MINTVPANAPVTIPDDDPMAAIAGLLLVHVPPAGVEFSVVVNPTQTASVPVMFVGLALTVTIAVLIHPVASVYVITSVPGMIPVTIPLVMPTFALLLFAVHVPPAGVELSVVVNPTHTFSVPVIVVGFGFTVTTAVIVQPVVGAV